MTEDRLRLFLVNQKLTVRNSYKGGVNHDKKGRKNVPWMTKRLTSRYGHKRCRPEHKAFFGSKKGLNTKGNQPHNSKAQSQKAVKV